MLNWRSIVADAIRRRDFLRGLSAAALAAGVAQLARHGRPRGRRAAPPGKACILLWMQGGPSQFETFSPKPGHANGGDTKAIATAVAGIQISRKLSAARQAGRASGHHPLDDQQGREPPARHLLAAHRLSADGQRQVSGVRLDRGQGIGAGRLRFALVRPHRQRAERQQRRAAGLALRSVRDAGGRQGAGQQQAGDRRCAVRSPAWICCRGWSRTMPRRRRPRWPTIKSCTARRSG